MDILMNLLILFALTLAYYSFYAIFNIIRASIGIINGNYDELEKKTITDALAISMAIFFAYNIIQFIIPILSLGKIQFNLFGPDIYLINFGSFKLRLIDPIVSNSIVISIVYSIMKYKNGLKNKWNSVIPILVSGVFAFFSTLYMV